MELLANCITLDELCEEVKEEEKNEKEMEKEEEEEECIDEGTTSKRDRQAVVPHPSSGSLQRPSDQ